MSAEDSAKGLAAGACRWCALEHEGGPEHCGAGEQSPTLRLHLFTADDGELVCRVCGAGPNEPQHSPTVQPWHGPPFAPAFTPVELVSVLARLESRIYRLEKALEEHGIYP